MIDDERQTTNYGRLSELIDLSPLFPAAGPARSLPALPPKKRPAALFLGPVVRCLLQPDYIFTDYTHDNTAEELIDERIISEEAIAGASSEQPVRTHYW